MRVFVSCVSLCFAASAVACTGNESVRSQGVLETHWLGSLPTDQVLWPAKSGEEALSSEERHSAIENGVTRCMKLEGFDYRQRQATEAQPSNPIDGNGSRVAQEGWVQEHGYGIVDGASMMTEAVDPNTAILDGLSPVEREAFYAAEDFCRSSTVRGLPASLEARPVPPEVMEAADRIVSDSDWSSAQNVWPGCMRKEGFDFSSRSEAPESISTRLSSLSDGERPMTSAELEALRREELSVARADLTCTFEVMAIQRAIEVQVNLDAGLIS
jgi:hypothetical protein